MTGRATDHADDIRNARDEAANDARECPLHAGDNDDDIRRHKFLLMG